MVKTDRPRPGSVLEKHCRRSADTGHHHVERRPYPGTGAARSGCRPADRRPEPATGADRAPLPVVGAG